MQANILITGATRGMGFVVAWSWAVRGLRIIMASRYAQRVLFVLEIAC